MKFKVQTLEEASSELMIHTSRRDYLNSFLRLYHYTSDSVKNLILDMENGTINFKLTKASDFLDKNEGIYIFEPYLHACGCLYNEEKIDKHFYELLKKINKSDILKNGDPWILCLSGEGYSHFMKERYAPGDGWQIALQANSFETLELDYDDYPNMICLKKVNYSYKKMKNQIQNVILLLYRCYQNDNGIDIEKKNKYVEDLIIEYLSIYNFCYKSESYKEEKEVRLIFYIKKDFEKWENTKDNQMVLYFKDGSVFLKFGFSCYFDSMQIPNIDNCMEMNKNLLKVKEIAKARRKREREEKN